MWDARDPTNFWRLPGRPSGDAILWRIPGRRQTLWDPRHLSRFVAYAGERTFFVGSPASYIFCVILGIRQNLLEDCG